MSTTSSSTPLVPDDLHRDKKRVADSVFKALSTSSGVLILLVLALVAVFLLVQGWDALAGPKDEMAYGNPEASSSFTRFLSFVAPFAFGTVYAAILALFISVPVSIGVALFISHYAPRRLAAGLGYVIDLLAAIPSIVFGLWGINVLAPAAQPIYGWLNQYLGFIPLFSGKLTATGRTMLSAALVLAVMILPIITALSREVFLQTPRLHEEAALAMGATRWEMIKMAVFPYSRPGVISACMLGLGRALGETMAVALVLSGSGIITFHLIAEGNSNTIAANIALNFPEATNKYATAQLIASGLVLFLITLAVNMLARWIVSRRKEFSGAN